MSILGIDIAKQTFDVYLIGAPPAAAHFANEASGFAALVTWLQQQEVTQLHACMEATGVYYEALAIFLVGQGYTVSVVNPWQIKAFAQSQLRRHKNDRQDAKQIAHFCQQQQPAPWQPWAAHERTLQAVVRHLDSLLEMRQHQRHRLESSRDPLVTASLQRLIAQLTAEITQIEQQIHDHVDAHPDLKHKQDLLTTIPGIGRQTTQHL